jgi:hypothetical protein
MDELKVIKYYVHPWHLHENLTWTTSGKVVVSRLERHNMILHIGILFIHVHLHEKLMWTFSCKVVSFSCMYV